MTKQEGEDMISGRDLEFYEQEEPADSEIKEFMDEEIAHVPQAPSELAERLMGTSFDKSGGFRRRH